MNPVVDPAAVPPKFTPLGWMRTESISATTMLALAWAFTVVTASLLLWAGISHAWLRAVMFLLVAGAAYSRWLCMRLSALAPVDGKDGPVLTGKGRRWGERAQAALILLAAGFCAFGSYALAGPILGALAAAMMLAGGFVARREPGLVSQPRPDPVLVVVGFGLICAIEGLWGWRGQSMLIGLLAILAILAFWLFRLARGEPLLP